jgi:DNA-binding response OmpR family regulator
MKILLVEDDLDLAENVIDYLELQGHSVDYATSGEAAVEFLHDSHYESVILDINLPGIDGFEVCKLIRQKFHMGIPIIMLTARSMLSDKLEGFQSGTDDYLSKPFELAELKMRLEALEKRANKHMVMKFCVEDLCVCPDEGTVIRGNKTILLPPICFTILLKLMENYPGIVTKDELEYAIWKDEPPLTGSLKVHLHTLRQLVDKPFEKQLLHSIRGRGYLISAEEIDI